MLFKLENSAKVEVIEGKHLPWIPTWTPMPDNIAIGSYNNMEEHEQHYLQTVGSGNWYAPDVSEFRFTEENLLLTSIWVQVLEENLQSSEMIEGWLNKKPVEGTLRLISPKVFRCEINDYRWMSSDGKLLAAINDTDLVKSDDKFRLRVANDFDLLFAERKWCGWLLSNPARYLTKPNTAADSDPELNSLTFEYVSLVSEPFIEQMDDKDPEIFKRLNNLRNKINLKDGAVEHRQVLYDCLGDVIENFYGTNALNG